MATLSGEATLPFSCFLPFSVGVSFSLSSSCHSDMTEICLTLLHSEKPKLYGVLAFLSAIGLKGCNVPRHQSSALKGKNLLPLEKKANVQTV